MIRKAAGLTAGRKSTWISDGSKFGPLQPVEEAALLHFCERALVECHQTTHESCPFFSIFESHPHWIERLRRALRVDARRGCRVGGLEKRRGISRRLALPRPLTLVEALRRSRPQPDHFRRPRKQPGHSLGVGADSRSPVAAGCGGRPAVPDPPRRGFSRREQLCERWHRVGLEWRLVLRRRVQRLVGSRSFRKTPQHHRSRHRASRRHRGEFQLGPSRPRLGNRHRLHPAPDRGSRA